MSVCVLQNLEKYRVLWTDFLASCREINRSSVSKIGPEPAKPTISLALPQNILDVVMPPFGLKQLQGSVGTRMRCSCFEEILSVLQYLMVWFQDFYSFGICQYNFVSAERGGDVYYSEVVY